MSASSRPTSAAVSATRGCCAAKRSRSAGWRMQVDYPVRWLEDCREHLTANANCREHHYQIRRLCRGRRQAHRRRLRRPCRCRRLFVVPDLISSGGGTNRQPAAGSLCFLNVPMPFGCRRHQQMPDPALPRRRATGVCLPSKPSWTPSPKKPGSSLMKSGLRNMVRPEQMPFDNVVGKRFDSGDHPECLRRAVEAIRP